VSSVGMKITTPTLALPELTDFGDARGSEQPWMYQGWPSTHRHDLPIGSSAGTPPALQEFFRRFLEIVVKPCGVGCRGSRWPTSGPMIPNPTAARAVVDGSTKAPKSDPRPRESPGRTVAAAEIVCVIAVNGHLLLLLKAGHRNPLIGDDRELGGIASHRCLRADSLTLRTLGRLAFGEISAHPESRIVSVVVGCEHLGGPHEATRRANEQREH